MTLKPSESDDVQSSRVFNHLDTLSTYTGSSGHERQRTAKRPPSLHIVPIGDTSTEAEGDIPRSTSATSSLDPYYFTNTSRHESPILIHGTAEVTPDRESILRDRNGLVGLGELQTPRWSKAPSFLKDAHDEALDDNEEGTSQDRSPRAASDDDRDSPWTIEAVDGELEEPSITSEETLASHVRRSISHQSVADESGGEEILYPRKPLLMNISEEMPQRIAHRISAYDLVGSIPPTPLSAFLSPARKAKKRSSDEFAFDQSGSPLPNSLAGMVSARLEKPDKPSLRKHHSIALGSTVSATPSRERKRGGSVRVSMNAGTSVNQTRVGKHSRQQSANSPSSAQVGYELRHRASSDADGQWQKDTPTTSTSKLSRRVSHHSTDLSSEKVFISKEKEPHSSPNVAHSLLRGTQEGWSGLDDEATAEALRKLDGISGKGARARGSTGYFSRSSNHSRPNSPASRSHRSDGTEASEKTRRAAEFVPNLSSSRNRDYEKSDPTGDKEIGDFVVLPKGESHGKEEVPMQPSFDSGEAFEARHLGSNMRLSFTPKRSSISSTNYAGTPTSSFRDSAVSSAATSASSVSVPSNKLSLKAKRNSAGSDISSVNSSDAHKERTLAVSSGSVEVLENSRVPPVPPLPKDLSSFKTPPQSTTSSMFTPVDVSLPKEDDPDKGQMRPAEATETQLSECSPDSVSVRDSLGIRDHPEISKASVPSAIMKSPSKKWSFTNPLNLRRSASPSRRDRQSTKSPTSNSRAPLMNKQLRASSSKGSPLQLSLSPKSSVEAWQTIRDGAMTSETSLVSFSSLGSLPEPSPPASPAQYNGVYHDLDARNASLADTASSENANHAVSYDQQSARGSPHVKPQSEQVNRRLTPSSIPFFRRSSSQSMHISPSHTGLGMSSSPTFSSAPDVLHIGLKTNSSSVTKPGVSSSTPGFSQRKSSMLSLGFPSILKGSGSKRSIQLDKSPTSSRISDKGKRTKESDENLKARKEEKDRSESRISVLMGRKRGKTLSSTDQKKVKPISLPPMQVSALPAATNERLSQFKSSPSTSSQAGATRAQAMPSRVTSQTISSMQKQSDSSLRSSRQQLPTIAGSPSVGVQSPANRQSLSMSSSMIGFPKETPTRIPRIASRSSTVSSPPLKSSTSLFASRRKSLNVGATGTRSESVTAETEESLEEFGVLDKADEFQSQTYSAQRQPSRLSPPDKQKFARQHSGFSAALSASGAVSRKAIQDIPSVKGLRKSSNGSISSMASAMNVDQHHPMSALSPSKGLNKLLSPKMSLPGSRLSSSSTAPNVFQQQSGSPSTRQESLSTPSPVPSPVDEDELLGDEEMLQYIRRTQARKLANGAKKEELDELLRFPEPLPPGRPTSSTAILDSDKSLKLSDYERKEIIDYANVYFVSEKNNKKLASRDATANNFGYDDERGDYQVINRDHLGYRYEIIDTLGKGSFGQVLHCRDHCTGESVAIKIIRNKKRFHHQALVEIKILENLRKWDPEEKHHVIKMTEHFYFRNHLCIAMELLSINLYELIKANGFAGFSTTLIRRFTSQMLLSLSLMRHHRIVHCDLKPENVLLRHPAKSAIKVIDFGSSCLEHEKVYTYIQSRFYRSPEVILGMNYNMAIDMWSLGCILAELYTGYPIFPGENEQEQLSCIMEVLGLPDKDLINRSSRKRLFFDSTGAPRPVVNSKGRRRRAGAKSLAQVLRCDDELFVDFVSKCLSWDPERRLKPQSALRHPFITAGKKAKILNNTSPPFSRERSHVSTGSLLNVGRIKPAETPKKPQISAPTPLAARSARSSATQLPSTPLGTLAQAMQSPAKSYRSPQAAYQSSRSMNGFVVAAAK